MDKIEIIKTEVNELLRKLINKFEVEVRQEDDFFMLSLNHKKKRLLLSVGMERQFALYKKFLR